MKIQSDSMLVMVGDSITDCQRIYPDNPEGMPADLGNGYVSFVDGLLTACYPSYRIQVLNRGVAGDTVRDEFLLANLILHLIDGRTDRSYGATCSDLTCGPGQGESFLEDIRDLFTAVRSGLRDLPMTGAVPFVLPSFHADHHRADEIIAVLETMQSLPDSWMLLVLHGVGAGTHNNYMDADEHCQLIDWIADQRGWLEAVTVLQAVDRRGRALSEIG